MTDGSDPAAAGSLAPVLDLAEARRARRPEDAVPGLTEPQRAALRRLRSARRRLPTRTS